MYQDMFMAAIFLFMFVVYMFITLQFLMLHELNKESSTEHSQESEIYTIPVDDEPAPSYETLFGLNTSPPPYEIATKENWKEMMEESLSIVCLEWKKNLFLDLKFVKLVKYTNSQITWVYFEIKIDKYT